MCVCLCLCVHAHMLVRGFCVVHMFGVFTICCLCVGVVGIGKGVITVLTNVFGQL